MSLSHLVVLSLLVPPAPVVPAPAPAATEAVLLAPSPQSSLATAPVVLLLATWPLPLLRSWAPLPLSLLSLLSVSRVSISKTKGAGENWSDKGRKKNNEEEERLFLALFPPSSSFFLSSPPPLIDFTYLDDIVSQ
jgi:hypothetical protein